jgi:hypothetical protein
MMKNTGSMMLFLRNGLFINLYKWNSTKTNLLIRHENQFKMDTVN